MKARENNKNIREDFRRKGPAYYEKNYSGNNNPLRTSRMELLHDIFSRMKLASCAVLDAGAGPAVLYEMISRFKGIYFASDISIDNLIAAHQRIGDFNGVVADTCSLPFKTASFDLAASIGSLEYIRDLDRAVSELARVVKDGFAVLSFANASSPARWWDENIIRTIRAVRNRLKKRNAYRRYLVSAPEAESVLARHGLAVESVHYYNAGLLGYPFRKSALLDKLQRKISDKSPFLEKKSLEFIIVAKKTG